MDRVNEQSNLSGSYFWILSKKFSRFGWRRKLRTTSTSPQHTFTRKC